LYKEHGNAWLRVPNKNGDLCEKCHESKGKSAREKEAKKRGVNRPLAIKLAMPPEKMRPVLPPKRNYNNTVCLKQLSNRAVFCGIKRNALPDVSPNSWRF
jgi:hypothetical protein